MNVAEMQYEFKIGLDKVDSLSVPNFLPEEIDIFLNNAQEQFISQRAFRTNPKREGLEENQKRTDDLKNIIKNFSSATFIVNADNKPNGKFVNLPSDYRHAIQEEAKVTYSNCKNVLTYGVAEIIPTTHDRYNRLIKDPFNKPNTEIVYRLGYERVNGVESFELLSDSTITISDYYLRYIKNPQVIRYGTQYQVPTTDLDCELSDHTHREIIAMAVKNALEDIESPRYQSSKIELNDIE